MRAALVLLLCLGCLFLLLGANCQVYEEDKNNATSQAIEELFQQKGLNPDQLAGSVVNAFAKSGRQTSRLLELILRKFKDCKVAASIIGALETSSASIARLHELLSAHGSNFSAH